MPKKPKSPAQLAKAKRSVLLNQVRNALIAGNEAQAYKICERHGYDIFEARLAPEYRNKSENWFVAKSAEIEAGKNIASESVKVGDETVTVSAEKSVLAQIDIKHAANSIFSPEVAALVPPPEPQSVTVAKITAVETEEPAMVEVRPEVEEQVVTDQRILNGFPAEAFATVWGFPRNPRLTIALLEDQRKVSVWKSQYNKHKINDRIFIRLDQPWLDNERQGDPVYLDLSKRMSTW